MQIAVRYDKVHPPRRIDVAEAAARAVLEATDPLWVDESGSANTAQDLERWGMMADFLRQINAVTTDIDVSSVVTNDYAAAPRSS